jgi:predicted transposase YdaD
MILAFEHPKETARRNYEQAYAHHRIILKKYRPIDPDDCRLFHESQRKMERARRNWLMVL